MQKNTNHDTPNDYCGTTFAAKLLGLSVGTIQTLVEKNELQAWKTQGGHRRISMPSIREYQRKHNMLTNSIEPRDTRLRVLPVEDDAVTRMQLLEKSLQEALGRLNAPPATARQPTDTSTTQTLPEVLAWLCTQNSVPLAVLRQKLLPLGLMTSALMDDVNERAFDVAGEPALDEAAGTVTVQRRVLLQVLAVM